MMSNHPHLAASAAITFSGNPLDRASEHRHDPVWIAARRADPACRILPLWQLKPLVTGSGDGPFAVAFLAPASLESLAVPDTPCVFLGLDGTTPLFALNIPDAEDPAAGALAGHGEFRDMRAAAAILPVADTAIAGQAKALLDWHARHRFCPNCGTLTLFADGGYRRICPQCSADHFPRTDPVVIMLPILEDSCLVGRNARFPAGLYSAFAGFIEPGETVEEAVRRELHEEVALEVGGISYHASQPWPFPSSLMIGCYALAKTRAFRIDQHEIADARWMDKGEVRARLAGTISDDIALPNPIAIAHRLMRDWAGR